MSGEAAHNTREDVEALEELAAQMWVSNLLNGDVTAAQFVEAATTEELRRMFVQLVRTVMCIIDDNQAVIEKFVELFQEIAEVDGFDAEELNTQPQCPELSIAYRWLNNAPYYHTIPPEEYQAMIELLQQANADEEDYASEGSVS